MKNSSRYKFEDELGQILGSNTFPSNGVGGELGKPVPIHIVKTESKTVFVFRLKRNLEENYSSVSTSSRTC